MASKTVKRERQSRPAPPRSEPHEEANKTGDASAGKEPPGKIIDRLLNRVLSQESEMKGSISDAIRLLQLKRELAGEELRKIEVQWVEPSDVERASNK